MDALQTYLDSQYKDDCNRRREVLSLMRRVLPLFPKTFTTDGWPYECSPDTIAPSVEKISIATVAMTASALRQTLLLDLPKEIYTDCLSADGNDKGKNAISATVNSAAKRLLKNDNKRKTFSSNTYGKKNVFTLSWYHELFELFNQDELRDLLQSKEECDTFKAAVQWSSERLSVIFDAVQKKIAIPFNEGDPSIDSRHAFPMLKAIRLYNSLNKTAPGKTANTIREQLISLGAQFEAIIHRCLSLSKLDNSRFDAAELVFTLESYLLCRTVQFNMDGIPDINTSLLCDNALLENVFSTLVEQQTISTYWMPLRPFISQSQGFALLPLSVEIMLSLLRIFKLLGPDGGKLFAKYHIVFDRYTEWVKTRLTPIYDKDTDDIFYGWSSEHIYRPDVIHVWQSSQILLFLAEYYVMLQKKIASDGLAAAKLFVKMPGKKDSDSDKYWNTTPLGSNMVHGKIHDIISESEEGDQSASFLLFGPPGTGKTYLAEQVSVLKQWPLLELSPSDFTAEGIEKLENKAKNLFTILCEQRDIVILFDEIDRLLLNRDSEAYKDQSDMFQVMVASLLVKFKQLRETPHIIFLVCTNYGHRLDPAIIRPGRIDRKILVLPIDLDQRIKQAKKIIEKHNEDHPNDRIDLEISSEIGKKTVLFSYGEIKQLTERVCKNKGVEIEKIVSEFVPTISLKRYQEQLFDKDKQLLHSHDLPLEEILLLAYIIYQCRNLSDEEIELVECIVPKYQQDALDRITAVMGESVSNNVKEMVSNRYIHTPA